MERAIHSAFSSMNSIETIPLDKTTDISEMADVFNLLMDVVRRSGHDIRELLNAVDKKLDVLETRKWGPPDENGVIEHIRE